MQTSRYERILADLRRAFDLCRSLGLDAQKSRFGDYERRLERLIEVSQLHREGRMTPDVEEELRREGLQYTAALTESTEFGEVLEQLAGSDPVPLRSKLKLVLAGGPDIPIDEDASAGNLSRNILFELSLAAKIKRAGLEPRLRETPDLICDVDDRLLGFECKRPFSENGIPGRIEHAGISLTKALADVRMPATARGVVAISLSKAMNPGDKLFVYSTEIRGRTGLEEAVIAVGKRYEEVWAPFDERILGVLFHVITPALDTEANREVVAQQIVVFDRSRGFFDRRMLGALRTAMETISH